MTRSVTVTAPSFPESVKNRPFTWQDGRQWQVLCGDSDHYRIGIYSPAETSMADVKELEKHTCNEFFALLSGSLTLVLYENGQVIEHPLKIGEAIYVTVPHNGYCPEGAHTGQAIVVERDLFSTTYNTIPEWQQQE